jgi:branched-chain amino acid transport system substrate-binding protein
MRNLLISAAIGASFFAGTAAAQTQGITEDEVKIGGQHDLSGIFAGFSAPAVEGARQYFKEVNAEGGIHGRKITYIVEDHGYNPSRAVQIVNKLVNSDRVFAMLLSLGTPHNLAAFKIQDPKGIPNVSPLTAARQMLQEPLDLHYAGTAAYYDQIRASIRWMKENKDVDTVCSMYLPTDFGVEIQEGSTDEAEALGLTYATETTHKPDESEFVGPLQKLNEAGCDLVTVALGLRQVITVLGTAKKLGYDDMIFLGSSAAFNTVVGKVPGGVTEGFYAASGWQDHEQRMEVPEVAAWVESYTEAVGEAPGTGSLLGRTAAETLVRALEAAGPDLNHESFQEGMESLEYEDKIAGNTVDYGPGDHQGSVEIFISQIENGAWKTVAALR